MRLPDSVQSDFSIIVETDLHFAKDLSGGLSDVTLYPTPEIILSSDAVSEFKDEGNNSTDTPLKVVNRPLPDLQVTATTAPEHGLVRQALSLSFTVANKEVDNSAALAQSC